MRDAGYGMLGDKREASNTQHRHESSILVDVGVPIKSA
jgi:hypothetical protein